MAILLFAEIVPVQVFTQTGWAGPQIEFGIAETDWNLPGMNVLLGGIAGAKWLAGRGQSPPTPEPDVFRAYVGVKLVERG